VATKCTSQIVEQVCSGSGGVVWVGSGDVLEPRCDIPSSSRSTPKIYVLAMAQQALSAATEGRVAGAVVQPRQRRLLGACCDYDRSTPVAMLMRECTQITADAATMVRCSARGTRLSRRHSHQRERSKRNGSLPRPSDMRCVRVSVRCSPFSGAPVRGNCCIRC